MCFLFNELLLSYCVTNHHSNKTTSASNVWIVDKTQLSRLTRVQALTQTNNTIIWESVQLEYLFLLYSITALHLTCSNVYSASCNIHHIRTYIHVRTYVCIMRNVLTVLEVHRQCIQHIWWKGRGRSEMCRGPVASSPLSNDYSAGWSPPHREICHLKHTLWEDHCHHTKSIYFHSHTCYCLYLSRYVGTAGIVLAFRGCQMPQRSLHRSTPSHHSIHVVAVLSQDHLLLFVLSLSTYVH